MKTFHIFISLTFSTLFLYSCGGKQTQAEKNNAELKKLKAQQKELLTKISTLEKNTGRKDSIKATPVIALPITPQMFNTYIEVQGKVTAENTVIASPEMPGVIQQIFVHTGQHVSKGQTIATLKTATINEGMAELDQQISFAKTIYDKQSRLWKQEVGTEVQLLSAKNNYEALVRKKTTLLSQKNMYNIKAPVSGVVDAVDITEGSAVSPGLPIGIRIVNTAKLKVNADIAENYASKVNSGSQAMIIFPDLNDTIFTRVHYITKVINNITRTFTAEINLQPNSRFRPNMIANVKIVSYQNRNAFVLPINVVQKTNEGNFVYIVDNNNKAKAVPVSIGDVYLGKVEIRGGLTIGDKVITTGYENLNEGDWVTEN